MSDGAVRYDHDLILSSCCKALVVASHGHLLRDGDDSTGYTFWHECTKCGKPCNPVAI